MYPTHFYCTACGKTKFEGVAIEGEGTLLTYTKTYSLPLDYTLRYLTLGIVQLDMGIRATGQLDVEQPKTGMRVKVTLGEVREVGGESKTGLIFAPIE